MLNIETCAKLLLKEIILRRSALASTARDLCIWNALMQQQQHLVPEPLLGTCGIP